MDQVAADAAAARHPAAAGDRDLADLADLGIKVGKLDQTACGMRRIVDLLADRTDRDDR